MSTTSDKIGAFAIILFMAYIPVLVIGAHNGWFTEPDIPPSKRYEIMLPSGEVQILEATRCDASLIDQKGLADSHLAPFYSVRCYQEGVDGHKYSVETTFKGLAIYLKELPPLATNRRR